MILAATRRGLAADKTPDDGEQHPNGSEGIVVDRGSRVLVFGSNLFVLNEICPFAFVEEVGIL